MPKFRSGIPSDPKNIRLKSSFYRAGLLPLKLIRELLPKLSRKKPDSNDQGWKQCHSGGGRYYNVLLHDEETGLSIEQQAEVEGILPQRVIAEAVALRAQHKSVQVQPSENVAAQLEKLQDLVKQAASLDTENKALMHQLQERDLRIAELEAKLTERASTTSAVSKETQVSHIHHEGSSEVAELDNQQGSNLRQLELSSSLHQAQTWLEVAAIVGCNRNQLLKIVNNWTKIGGANNLVDAAQFEYICRNFVSLEYPGSRNEQWVFRDSDNRLYSFFVEMKLK